MFRYLFALTVNLTVSTLACIPVMAGPLTKAEVTKIINQVSVVDPHTGDRPAVVRDVIKDDLALATGKKSRSELLFQDNTLTRIGAETFFSFKTGTRDLTLEKGSMLLQVPKGLGGAQIHTAAVTAAITGTTIMMEYIPDQYIKVLVLEGSLRVSRNGSFGNSLLLHPGKMVIMRPDAKKIPDPVDVDLEHIVKTSSLVNFPGADPLPSMSLIQSAIADQQNQLAKRDLVPTNLVIGHGTAVTVASGNLSTGLVSASGSLGANAGGVAVGSVKSVTSSLPAVGGIVSPAGNTLTATTTSAGNVIGSTTASAGTTINDLLGATSSSSSGSVTAVNNLLASTTSSTGSAAGNVLSISSPVASIPASSSSQLLALIDAAAPSTGGVVNISPTAISTSPTTTTASATTSPANAGSTAPATTTATVGSTTPSTSMSSPVITSTAPSAVTTSLSSGSATIASVSSSTISGHTLSALH